MTTTCGDETCLLDEDYEGSRAYRAAWYSKEVRNEPR